MNFVVHQDSIKRNEIPYFKEEDLQKMEEYVHMTQMPLFLAKVNST
jgi:hypothetical protein